MKSYQFSGTGGGYKKMFTAREWEYLDKLEKRNHNLLSEEDATGKERQIETWYPLEKPMSIQERKIRSSIQRKMTLNAQELAYAFLAWMPPEKPLFRHHVFTLERMVHLFKGIRWIELLRERGDLEEIIETKYSRLDMIEDLGSAAELIRPMLKRLRDEFRAKNPEVYDALEKKLDEEIKRVRQSF
jgi:hypothetical protein